MIGQAQAVSTNLGEQRHIFDNIGSKLVNVSSKFPVVNGVMNAIRRKKNKVRLSCLCAVTFAGYLRFEASLKSLRKRLEDV